MRGKAARQAIRLWRNHSVFAKNKQRLLDADVARESLLETVE